MITSEEIATDNKKKKQFMIESTVIISDLLNMYIQITLLFLLNLAGTGCTSTQTIKATDEFQFLSGPNFPDKYSRLIFEYE